jgi:hypothetical protein
VRGISNFPQFGGRVGAQANQTFVRQYGVVFSDSSPKRSIDALQEVPETGFSPSLVQVRRRM